MKNAPSPRPAIDSARKLPDPPDYVPEPRPGDQDAFDEAVRVGYQGIRELLERRRKKP